MKRLKRNRIQRALDKGYNSALLAAPRKTSPLTGLARSKWLEGWREGETIGRV